MTGSEIDIEQQHLDTCYAWLDMLREEAAARLAAVPDTGHDTVKFWRTELSRLDSAEEGLYFGRLDLHDGPRVHVGRIGLFRDGKDEPLLVDWRAPAARPFYTATTTAPHGVRRRRHITTRGRAVTALDDELLDLDSASDDTLIGEAALLASLVAGRTGRMRDIVTTLQAEQDRIIRDDHTGVLVVQGGPGTGKTAVALHRLAYLLYARPHLRSRGVLVVGPSRIFLDYIGQVLPGLGEHTVVTTTIAGLVPDVLVSREDSPEAAEAKGREEMAERIAAAARSRVRTPETPVEIVFEDQVLRLDPGVCRRAITTVRETGLPHNQARLVFHREIVDELAQIMIDLMERLLLTESGEALDGGSLDGSLGEADLRALAAAGVVIGTDELDGPRNLLDQTDAARLRDALQADASVQDTLERLWPRLTPEDLVAELAGTSSEGWSTADIPLLDEAAAVLGEHSGETFGHVVVDEAQELSAMAWRMLSRRCPSKSMTVVGDLAQTGTMAGATSWDDVLRPHSGDRRRLALLTVNYRTPAEIMAATTDLLEAHHPGLRPPRSIRSCDQPPWRIRTTPTDLPEVISALAEAHNEGQLAIISPPAQLERLAKALSVATPPDLAGEIVVLTPSQAKGLEFDSVIVADPAEILAEPLGHNNLYVAMTRATQRLGIVHPGAVPAELAGLQERTP
ncbi:HelD family protein [Amycolatopsis sp. NPDC052450]|uniref:HelD family protein n=1 Tax=Amycolatopsis sp. NPDC052450 TaxID=3363937 RepID=UPI0037C9C816